MLKFNWIFKSNCIFSDKLSMDLTIIFRMIFQLFLSSYCILTIQLEKVQYVCIVVHCTLARFTWTDTQSLFIPDNLLCVHVFFAVNLLLRNQSIHAIYFPIIKQETSYFSFSNLQIPYFTDHPPCCQQLSKLCMA